MEKYRRDKNLILKLRKNKLKIFVWTCNSEEEISYFIKLGIDGIITDNPPLANKIIEKYKTNISIQ